MSYEDRKRRRLIKRKIRNILFLGILFLFMARTAYGIIFKNPKTALAEEREYVISIVADSILIKDERVYELVGHGSFNKELEEGKRISQGYEIAKAHIVKDISSLKDELEEIDRAIEQLSSKNEGPQIFQADVEDLQSQREELIDQLQRMIREKDYSQIEGLKEKIKATDDKLTRVSADDSLLNQSLDRLRARREEIVEEIKDNSLSYYADRSGIFSLEIDGYENVYIPKDFENYTYERLQIPEKLEEAEGDTDNRKFKIINNFNWYLAIKIDNIKNISSFEVKDSIFLKIADIDRELRGQVVAINESKDKAVIVVEFDSHLHDYYNMRFPKVEVVTHRQDAFLIPTRAIIEKDGQAGVYIKEFNGIVRFRPIEILAEEGKFTFISRGDENRYIKNKSGEKERTISLYDEILINPQMFKEGEILN